MKKKFETTFTRVPDRYLADQITKVCNDYGTKGWEPWRISEGVRDTKVIYFKREVETS